MDILNQNEIAIELDKLKCVHNASINSRYGSTHVVVFLDETKVKTYLWVTSTSTALGFEVNKYYKIGCKLCTDTNRVTHIKELFNYSEEFTRSVKSEQPDAQDVLLGLANYK